MISEFQLPPKSLLKASDFCGIIYANLVGLSVAKSDPVNIGIDTDLRSSSADNIRKVKTQFFFTLFKCFSNKAEGDLDTFAFLYKNHFRRRNVEVTDFIVTAIGINDINTEFFQVMIVIIRIGMRCRLLICTGTGFDLGCAFGCCLIASGLRGLLRGSPLCGFD